MVKQKRAGVSGKKGGSIINAELNSSSPSPKKKASSKKGKKASRGK